MKTIFFLLFLLTFLFGADRNDTLINADVKVYQALLRSLESTKESSDEIVLQKSLLRKLITGIDGDQTKKISLLRPKSQKEYVALFFVYLENIQAGNTNSDKLDQIRKKKRAVENEIDLLDRNDTQLPVLQLQDAFYTKRIKYFRNKIDENSDATEKISEMLSETVTSVAFDNEMISKELLASQALLQKQQDAISRLQIEKEQLEMLDDRVRIDSINKTISAKKEQLNKLVTGTAGMQFLLFSDALKSKRKEAFSIEQEIEKSIKQLQVDRGISNEVVSLLHRMEKKRFGAIETLTESTSQEVKNMVLTFWKFINSSFFSINETPVSLFKLIMTLVIFIMGFIVGGLYKTYIKKIDINKKRFTSSTKTLLANLGYYTIILLAFFISLNILGINMSSIALVAGALSVGIGFGLQNIVSNFVSGLILMFERSVRIGDYVELAEGLRGRISDIRMRSTTITTNNNIDIIVPNQNFVQNNVINWTMNDLIRRMEIPFGVKYGTKPEKVIEVVLNAVKESGFEDMYNTPLRHARVIMVGMGNSSVDYELMVWIEGIEILYPKRTTSRFMVLIYNALYENDIEIPFPQQDLHIRSIDEKIVFPLTLNKEHE